MLCLYVRVRGVSNVSAGILSSVEQGVGKIGGAGVGEAAAEDGDEVLATERLRHEFPAASGFGVTGEGGFHQGRRVEFGFHGFHQVFGGMLCAVQARLFFFDFTDLAVNLVPRGFGQGVEKFLQAFGLAEFAGKERMDGHGERKPYHGWTRIQRIFTDSPQRTRRAQSESAFFLWVNRVNMLLNSGMTKVNIDQLSEEELIELNHKIVARLRFLRQMQSHAQMLDYRIGERVRFYPAGRPEVTGILTRYNKKECHGHHR